LDDAGTKNADSLSRTKSYSSTEISNVVRKTYSITASGTQAIDFSGSITDFAGNTVTWTKLVALMVYHDTASAASSISFGPRNGTNPVANIFGASTHTVTLKPGSDITMKWEADDAITLSSSADNFLITNNDGSNAATVEVAFLGDD